MVMMMMRMNRVYVYVCVCKYRSSICRATHKSFWRHRKFYANFVHLLLVQDVESIIVIVGGCERLTRDGLAYKLKLNIVCMCLVHTVLICVRSHDVQNTIIIIIMNIRSSQ